LRIPCIRKDTCNTCTVHLRRPLRCNGMQTDGICDALFIFSTGSNGSWRSCTSCNYKEQGSFPALLRRIQDITWDPEDRNSWLWCIWQADRQGCGKGIQRSRSQSWASCYQRNEPEPWYILPGKRSMRAKIQRYPESSRRLYGRDLQSNGKRISSVWLCRSTWCWTHNNRYGFCLRDHRGDTWLHARKGRKSRPRQGKAIPSMVTWAYQESDTKKREEDRCYRQDAWAWCTWWSSLHGCKDHVLWWERETWDICRKIRTWFKRHDSGTDRCYIRQSQTVWSKEPFHGRYKWRCKRFISRRGRCCNRAGRHSKVQVLGARFRWYRRCQQTGDKDHRRQYWHVRTGVFLIWLQEVRRHNRISSEIRT